MHLSTKFQADNWNHWSVKAVTSSLGPGPSLFWKFQSSMERAKIGVAWLFQIVTCAMLLCIIPLNFRPIAEILKESERSSFGPGQKNYHGKFQSSVERAKIGRAWSFQIAICSTVLCIIPLNFRLIAEILNVLQRERRSGRTEGRADGRADRQTDGVWTLWPTTIPVSADGGRG